MKYLKEAAFPYSQLNLTSWLRYLAMILISFSIFTYIVWKELAAHITMCKKMTIESQHNFDQPVLTGYL